jgi:hypothetical protein
MTTLDLFDEYESIMNRLISDVEHVGVSCLIFLFSKYPQAVKVARIAKVIKVKDRYKTLDPVLDTCELHGYATRKGTSPADSMTLTDKGREMILQLIASAAGLADRLLSRLAPSAPVQLQLVDNSPDRVDKIGGILYTPSSSSDLDQESDLDQIRSEEERNFEKISTLLDRHGVTGKYRADILADDRCTDRLVAAWLIEVELQQRSGVIFRRSATAYACACMLNATHNTPPARALAELDRREAEAEKQDDAESEDPVEKISTPPEISWPAVATEHQQLWQAALGELPLEMTKATYDTWVKPCRVYQVEGEHWTIVTPNADARDWLNQRLLSTVQRVLVGITGQSVSVEFMSADMRDAHDQTP